MNSLVCTTAIHDAIRADLASWSRCQLLGVSRWDACEDEPAGAMEVRLCPSCGGSMGKEVTL